jgi:hypothetical protein
MDSVTLVGRGVGDRMETLRVCFVGTVVTVGSITMLGYVLGSRSVESEGLKGRWFENCIEDFGSLCGLALYVGLVGEELVD